MHAMGDAKSESAERIIAEAAMPKLGCAWRARRQVFFNGVHC
jgi:hypothetical protein